MVKLRPNVAPTDEVFADNICLFCFSKEISIDREKVQGRGEKLRQRDGGRWGRWVEGWGRWGVEKSRQTTI